MKTSRKKTAPKKSKKAKSSLYSKGRPAQKATKSSKRSLKGTQSPKVPPVKDTAEWVRETERELDRILKKAITVPAIRRLGPKPATCWMVSVSLIGTATMTRLNAQYRGKAYPTDVLSFPAPEVFQKQGQLGELVICLPTMKRQAKELGHSPEQELKVLLVHGLLHLLGEDHEQGAKASARMAALEAKLLPVKGLIQRTESCT